MKIRTEITLSTGDIYDSASDYADYSLESHEGSRRISKLIINDFIDNLESEGDLKYCDRAVITITELKMPETDNDHHS
jgi:hypothetical protein